MKFEKTEVWGFEHALRGMRNPMESYDKSDSYWTYSMNEPECDIHKFEYFVGDNDLDLAKRLVRAGSDHRKFLRQIFVSVDITAPLYFYKEFDTYKIGTVANSTSTMHKIATTPITINCFETDDMQPFEIDALDYVIEQCERYRIFYLTDKVKNKDCWKALIRLLPESWLQTRTLTLNYEVLRNIYHARKNHKLSEWHQFCEWIESLPYAKELIMLDSRADYED